VLLHLLINMHIHKNFARLPSGICTPPNTAEVR